MVCLDEKGGGQRRTQNLKKPNGQSPSHSQIFLLTFKVKSKNHYLVCA